MSDSSRSSRLSQSMSIPGGQVLSNVRIFTGHPGSRVRAPAQPKDTENQRRPFRLTTSEELPLQTTAHEFKPKVRAATEHMSLGGRPHFPPILLYSSSPPPQRDTGLVMPNPGSVELSQLGEPFTKSPEAHDPHKWGSATDHIKSCNERRALPLPRASKRATVISLVNSATNKSTNNDGVHNFSDSETGDSRSSSGLESEAGNTSPVLRSSKPTLDAAVHDGKSLADPNSDSPLRPQSPIYTPGAGAASAPDEFRAMTTELKKLLGKFPDVEPRFSKLLKIAHQLGREEALKELGDALSDALRDSCEIRHGKI